MSDTFRKAYRELTDAEKGHVEAIKDAAERLETLIRIESVGVHTEAFLWPPMDENAARYRFLALTNLEQAVMWAVKAAT
jgi:uncharacterized membrane protein